MPAPAAHAGASGQPEQLQREARESRAQPLDELRFLHRTLGERDHPLQAAFLSKEDCPHPMSPNLAHYSKLIQSGGLLARHHSRDAGPEGRGGDTAQAGHGQGIGDGRLALECGGGGAVGGEQALGRGRLRRWPGKRRMRGQRSLLGECRGKVGCCMHLRRTGSSWGKLFGWDCVSVGIRGRLQRTSRSMAYRSTRRARRSRIPSRSRFLIRLISARPAIRRERRIYEEDA